jgi:hypothetical protein
MDVNFFRGNLPIELFDSVMVERKRTNNGAILNVLQFDWSRRSIHTKKSILHFPLPKIDETRP